MSLSPVRADATTSGVARAPAPFGSVAAGDTRTPTAADAAGFNDPAVTAVALYRRIADLYPRNTTFTIEAGNPSAERLVAVIIDLLRLRGDTVLEVNAPSTGWGLKGGGANRRAEAITISVDNGRDGVLKSAVLLVGLVRLDATRDDTGRLIWHVDQARSAAAEVAATNTADSDRYFQRGLSLEASDRAAAIDNYRLAIARGDHRAALRMGLLLIAAGNAATGLPYVASAATAGNPMAEYVYGAALASGDGVQKDVPKGIAMLQRAAAAGIEPAAQIILQTPH